MIKQPAFPGEPATISHQVAVLTYHPVTGDQDSEVVGGTQPADLLGMQLDGPGHVVIGSGLSHRDPAQGLENRNLSRGEIEPALQVVGEGKWPGGTGEVLVQPGGGQGTA